MAETTPPKPGRKRERDVVVEPELSEYELHRNKRIKANEAFLEALGLGGTGQKLPKKPRAKPKPKRKFEEHEKRKSVRLQGGPAPIERLHDDPRSYDDFFESRKRQKRAPRQEPWEPTDEQRERLGIFCMEGFYDWLGTTTKYHKEISPDNRKTVIRQVTTNCVEIKILRRVRAESSRRPPRHRRDACSTALWCRLITARRSQHDRVIAEK